MPSRLQTVWNQKIPNTRFRHISHVSPVPSDPGPSSGSMRPCTAVNKLPTNILTSSSAAPARLRALQPQCGGLRGPPVVALPPSLRTFESQAPEPHALVSRRLVLSEIKLSAPGEGR